MLAEDWIKDAYIEIGINDANDPIDANKTQTAIRYANRMMASVDYLGLGYAEIDSTSDTVTIPPYAEEWAVLGLAVRLSKQFGNFEGLPLLIEGERIAFRNMLRHITVDVSMNKPDTLPMGSGNQDSCYGSVFYPSTEDAELTEDGGHTLLE